jgi:hypothetical protein
MQGYGDELRLAVVSVEVLDPQQAAHHCWHATWRGKNSVQDQFAKVESEVKCAGKELLEGILLAQFV